MFAFMRRSAACGIAAGALTASILAVGSAADVPVANQSKWTAVHPSVGGPMLDPAWFARRRVIVYLVPEGGETPAMRRVAGAIMQDRWTEGDWSLKHVIVSDVNRVRFALRQRAAIHDIALRVTQEAGQDETFVAENEEFIQQHVFFVRDTDRAVWKEMLGEVEKSGTCKILLLDYGGRLVRTIDPAKEMAEIADGDIGGGAQSLAAEVRKMLPMRPELDG